MEIASSIDGCSCPWLGGGETRDDDGWRSYRDEIAVRTKNSKAVRGRANADYEKREGRDPRFNEPVDRENDNADEETEKGDDDDDDVSRTLITTVRARTKCAPRLDNDRSPSLAYLGRVARGPSCSSPRRRRCINRTGLNYSRPLIALFSRSVRPRETRGISPSDCA